jgi:ferredoxin
MQFHYITEDCISCGQCLEYCPHGAITLKDTGGYAQAMIDPVKCKACGQCLTEDCPGEAIKQGEI